MLTLKEAVTILVIGIAFSPYASAATLGRSYLPSTYSPNSYVLLLQTPYGIMYVPLPMQYSQLLSNTGEPPYRTNVTPEPPCTTTTTPEPPCWATTTPEPPCWATTTPEPPCWATTTPEPPCATTNTPEPPCATTNTPEPPCATTNTPEPPSTKTTTTEPPCTATTTPKPRCTTTTTPEPESVKVMKMSRWKHFTVYPDPAFDQKDYKLINDALYNLMEAVPCIKFRIWPKNAEPIGECIHVVKGASNGCDSFVGRTGGKQIINLQSPGCMDVGTIMHEMIHCLGIDHEHVRPDRDQYVEIRWENIIPKYEFAFKINTDQNSLGVPYNYGSIMHYGSKSFSKNGLPTIVAKNGTKLGTEGKLKDTDIQKLRILYNCTNAHA